MAWLGLLQKFFSALRAGGPLAWLGLLQKFSSCARGSRWLGLAYTSKNFLRAARGGAHWLGLDWLTSNFFLCAARRGPIGLAWLTSKNFGARWLGLACLTLNILLRAAHGGGHWLGLAYLKKFSPRCARGGWPVDLAWLQIFFSALQAKKGHRRRRWEPWRGIGDANGSQGGPTPPRPAPPATPPPPRPHPLTLIRKCGGYCKYT